MLPAVSLRRSKIIRKAPACSIRRAGVVCRCPSTMEPSGSRDLPSTATAVCTRARKEEPLGDFELMLVSRVSRAVTGSTSLPRRDTRFVLPDALLERAVLDLWAEGASGRSPAATLGCVGGGSCCALIWLPPHVIARKNKNT